ncbi:hypothetical protein L1987_20224 [Smallanthus sonchifolius]|uniref:Uncharacterized protein n=1 Tax=Smallanthus sonchifolius TaxID=185202 RepID=A0ACB9ISW8_9ASTR|nr:hypothetical protein L1987_20224 [Smallanthus sonchifolius]
MLEAWTGVVGDAVLDFQQLQVNFHQLSAKIVNRTNLEDDIMLSRVTGLRSWTFQNALIHDAFMASYVYEVIKDMEWCLGNKNSTIKAPFIDLWRSGTVRAWGRHAPCRHCMALLCRQ